MEQFFQICSRFDEVEITELLLRRYNSLTSFYEMNADELVSFISYAIEKEDREEHKAQWNNLLPFMGMGFLKFQSFNDYYDACKGKNIDLRPASEVIAEITKLHESVKGG